MQNTEIIVKCCKFLRLSKEEATAVLQILKTPEQRAEMVNWLRLNILRFPDPISVIMGAGEIQEEHNKRNL